MLIKVELIIEGDENTRRDILAAFEGHTEEFLDRSEGLAYMNVSEVDKLPETNEPKL